MASVFAIGASELDVSDRGPGCFRARSIHSSTGRLRNGDSHDKGRDDGHGRGRFTVAELINDRRNKMRARHLTWPRLGGLAVGLLLAFAAPSPGQAQQQKPNILVIMGDDVGWSNIGVYNQGIMSGRTPNLDRLANEGMRFTDYYAEASCPAGRANFITGELPIRTGLTTVGQAGSPLGIPDEAVTIAQVLKASGYVTGQFGKNHLGDLNKFLPTVHGFDEFFGYLYHLDAMSDPFWYSFPSDPAFFNKYGPRNLVHCWATDKDDDTVMPRWGKVGKQKIEDK